LVFDQLKKSKKNYVVFNGSKPNPSIETVNSIIKAYNDNNCDALITIGGGSPHDAAKAAGLLLSNSKRINKLQGINVSKNAFKMPLICINTTAGSGSEASNIAVITDEHRQHKMTIVDKHCQPRATINDSQMMLDLPPETTAWTGIDALTHAVEAYLSIINNSMVKIYARRAMDIISEYLPIAYKTPSNSVAREKMAYAEFLAGISFNSASLGFVHSMSHALSGMFNTPHGLANAILLPYVLDYELKNKKIGLMLGEISDHMNFANLDAD
jgi:alcohol dehydrogenase